MGAYSREGAPSLEFKMDGTLVQSTGSGIMGVGKMYEVKKTGTPFTVTVDDVEEITAINAPEAKAIRGSFQGKLMGDSGNLVDITDGKFSTQ